MSNMSRIDSLRITISPESSISLGKWPSDMNPVSGRDNLVSRNVGSDADKREHENSKDFFLHVNDPKMSSRKILTMRK